MAGETSTARLVHPQNSADTRREAWTEAIARAAGGATRPALFIGHGLGAAAIADARPRARRRRRPRRLLVAPPDERGLERLAGVDWTPARAPLPWPSVVIASRNDPLGVYDAVAELAADWGAELIDAGQAGGLDAASGHGPWPEGLMRLAAFMRGIGERRTRRRQV